MIRRKYPRTPHLEWSPGATSDDKKLKTQEHFDGHAVVVTAKLDGENTTMYHDYVHARSLDYSSHPSRDKIRALHAIIRQDIPPSFRICGENMTAIHSIAYEALPAFFQVFSIWDNDTCLSWGDTVEWCRLLGLAHVPVLYEGVFDEVALKSIYPPSLRRDDLEGFVVRVKSSFEYEDFGRYVAKFVRPNHVTTDEHWSKTWKPNKIVYRDSDLKETLLG